MNATFTRRLIGLVVTCGLIGAVGLAIIRHQDILDWWALRDYSPPARVVKLADDTSMNDQTRRVFYANHPSIDDKTIFRSHCKFGEQSIVLGCYVSLQGIFVLDVTDARLNGVEEVTAAHELLHAEYDRLSSSERRRVDSLTANFFATLQDERVKKTIEQYRAKDPSVVPNELHSILGTEVRSLTPELETYYSRYFTSRQKIVTFSEQYEQTFIDLKNEVSAYDVQLASLKGQIEANESQITTLGEQIEQQRAELDRLLSSGQTEAYNARVPTFNQLVNRYNGVINESRRIIAEYNTIVEKRNDVATTEQELVQAIDSKSIPAEQKQ